jgi:uncharacterized protein
MTDTTATAATAPVAIESIVDRLSYVAWRTDWRTRYAAASETIRAAKRDLVAKRAAWRANAPSDDTESYEYRINSLIERMPWLRRQARILMHERTHATAWRDEAIAEIKAKAATAASDAAVAA